MPAVVIDGKAAARRVRDEVATGVAALVAAGGTAPGLATVLIGDDPASHVYVRNKRRACVEAGMTDLHRQLPADVSQQRAAALIDELAVDPAVSGILLQLPLPEQLDSGPLLSRIPAAKDVDGLTAVNAGLLAQGLPGLRPCTPSGVMRLLDDYEVSLAGAQAVVVGRSVLVGKPMAQLLLERHATVTVCHSRTKDLAEICRRADVLVVAAGVPGIIGGEAIAPGATVIDVGIHRGEKGLRGDVLYDEAAGVAGLITPVPGGVGPMTIAMLLANTLAAARAQQSDRGHAADAALTAGMFEKDRSEQIVVGSFSATPSRRLRSVLGSLVGHLHGFAKDVALTQAELDTGIDFLTRTGQTCDDTRQEFVLLSDVLGLSMLVDAMDHDSAGATDSTVLGPFHMVASPPRQLGESIALAPGGEPTLVTGQVLDVDGRELSGALVDVWQADEKGFYDVQIPDQVPERNLRGLFTCDEHGRFAFRTILPAPYPIPHDGPVGQLLAATERHPYRPAHIHFIATATGHAALTTHIFVAGSPYLDSDAVFGVKESLVLDFPFSQDAELAQRHGITVPFRHAHVEIRLRQVSL
jgi:methylenetetrahydrofolate dehydrogenase (NADP+)/methenyltetrahydrofolate cyclohydrolase